MPMKRIVILGDSLSDIGNMKDRHVSKFAVLNDLGRFSDGKNWVDFLWEHFAASSLYTKDASRWHRTLADAHRNGGGKELVCYAEGGALATGSTKGINSVGDTYKATRILSNLEAQIAKYFTERGDTDLDEEAEPLLGGSGPAARVKKEETLHIVWLGGNDVVTVNRDPDVMADIADAVMLQAVQLTLSVPGSRVVVIDLPDPQYMPRFAGDTFKQQQYNRAAENFNQKLAWYAAAMDKVSLFQISKVMSPKLIASLGFAPFHAQPKGAKSGAKIGAESAMTASLLQHTDIGIDEFSEYAAVVDQLHPTEGVYEVIAGEIIKYLTKRKFI